MFRRAHQEAGKDNSLVQAKLRRPVEHRVGECGMVRGLNALQRSDESAAVVLKGVD